MEDKDFLIDALKESVELMREEVSRHRESNRRLRAINSMLRKQIIMLMEAAETNDEQFRDSCTVVPIEGGLPIEHA